MQTALTTAGSVVVIRGERWRIEGIAPHGDVTALHVASASSRSIRHRTFLRPFDVATSGDRRRLRRVRRRHALAKCARLIADIDRIEVPLAALRADMDVLPHQLEPAMAVLAGARRVLLADDVGLGKTIQSGLVIAEIMRRRPDARILIVVPASLRDQWVDELRQRFNVIARCLDASSLGQIASTLPRSANPWSQAGACVVSLDYLKQRHVLDALPPRLWDLVVIDEVHTACGNSDRHRAACRVAERARHLLLLTATPHSGDDTTAAALLNIGVIDGLDDRLVLFRRTRRALGWPNTRRVRLLSIRPGAADARLFDALIAFETTALAAATHGHGASTRLLLSVLRKRALSTPAAFVISATRRLAWLRNGTLDTGGEQMALDFGERDDSLNDEDARGLTGTIALSVPEEERWLARLIALGTKALGADSKLARLATLIRRTHEPVIVFTEFRDSLAPCRAHLENIATVVELHGGLSATDATLALASFGKTARVLLTTDVASQGLNLQRHSRWVINLDLPWNPARLEQRAGRVDRLGQTRTTHVTLLAADHPLEAQLIERLHARTHSARTSFHDDALLRDVLPPVDRATPDQIFEHREAPSGIWRSSRWSRAAHLIAVDLARRRRLILNQPAHLAPGRPIRSAARLTRDSAVAVFTVPLVNANSAIVERHVVAVRVAAGSPVSLAELGGDAIRQLRDGRRRQAEARVRMRARRLAAIDRALTAALREQFTPPELQPGLFDRRDAARREELASICAAIDARFERTRQMLENESVLTVGPARLEIVFG